jgi:hypothetical protein
MYLSRDCRVWILTVTHRRRQTQVKGDLHAQLNEGAPEEGGREEDCFT